MRGPGPRLGARLGAAAALAAAAWAAPAPAETGGPAAVPVIEVSRAGDALAITGLVGGPAGTEVTGRLTVARVSGGNRLASNQARTVTLAGEDAPVTIARMTLDGAGGPLEAGLDVLAAGRVVARARVSLDLGAATR